MFRKCSHCGEPFKAQDLCKDVSRELEHQRMAAGVEGVLVRVYTCAQCQKDDVFVDVTPLPDESEEAFHDRKRELERIVHQLPKTDADVVLAERPIHTA
jgi:DNA-directed RNA polymerase subunit RPC12/RpoP